MVNVFTRSLDDNLASLVKQIDKAVAENQSSQLSAFLVLLTDDPDDAEAQLKKFASEHGIEQVPLTIYDGPAGPKNYKIAENADVTVNLWVGQTAKANHAFEKGGLDKKAIAKIVTDTEKLVQ